MLRLARVGFIQKIVADRFLRAERHIKNRREGRKKGGQFLLFLLSGKGIYITTRLGGEASNRERDIHAQRKKKVLQLESKACVAGESVCV